MSVRTKLYAVPDLLDSPCTLWRSENIEENSGMTQLIFFKSVKSNPFERYSAIHDCKCKKKRALNISHAFIIASMVYGIPVSITPR